MFSSTSSAQPALLQVTSGQTNALDLSETLPGGESSPLAPRPVAPASVRAVRRSWREVTPTDWDDFLSRTGGSFLGAANVIRLRRLVSRVSVYDFETTDHASGNNIMIARCAVIIRKQEVIFLDRIHILPEFHPLWPACFREIVNQLGEKNYVYGSLWNQEDPSWIGFDDYQVIRTPKKSFHIDVVAAGEYHDFAQYFAAVSKNVQRDYNKAQRSGVMSLDIRRGAAALALLRHVLACREQVKARNGAGFEHARSWVSDYIGIAAKMLISRDRGVIAVAKFGASPLAAFVGIEFGNRLYYITGGTKSNKEGAGSFLILSLVKSLFDKSPRGQLVLGFTAGSKRPEEYETGAHLYRRKIRAKATSGVYEMFSVKALVNGSHTAKLVCKAVIWQSLLYVGTFCC